LPEKVVLKCCDRELIEDLNRRRTFITNLATKGIGVRVLASLAGHRNISVTQKYIDVNDDMKRNAVELV
jgi:integrase/recombinase XerD